MFGNATNAHTNCKYNTLSFNMYGNVEKHINVLKALYLLTNYIITCQH
mgnify:CR=1 FL=1